jgi:hypothetical protein
MSSAVTPSSTSSNFETLFNAALEKYTKQTGKDLRNHPLVSKIDSCNGPDAILDIFQEQAQAFDEFRRGDPKLFKWLRPVVNVLHSLSTNEVLRDSVSYVSPANFLIFHVFELSIPQVFPSAKAVFSAVGILLSVRISLVITVPFLVKFENRDFQTAKYVRESYDALVDIFECIENFLRRLRIYTDVPLTPAMTEVLVKIMVELLSVLALATKQINRGRFSMTFLTYNHSLLTCCREIRG